MGGALKGAVDGGLHIPHNTKNLPGYKAAEEKGAESEYDAEAHKDRIFGNHVKEDIEKIKEDPDGEETEKKDVTHTRNGATINSSDGTEHIRTIKLTLKERRDKVAAKIQKAQEKMLAGDD